MKTNKSSVKKAEKMFRGKSIKLDSPLTRKYDQWLKERGLSNHGR